MELKNVLRQALESITGTQSEKSPDFHVTEQFVGYADANALVKSQKYLDQYFGWTYLASLAKAEAIADYDIALKRKTGMTAEGEIESEVVTGDKDEMLNDYLWYNPYQSLREARIIRDLHLELAGMAFEAIFTSDDRNHKFEFYILRPDRVKVVSNQFGLPKWYVYSDKNGAEHNIDPRDIIVHKRPNPADWTSGVSPLQASRYEHNTSEFMSRFNMNFFGNNARPEGFLVSEGIKEKERKRLEKLLKEKYGGVDNAGKIGIINRILQWVPLTTQGKDLDYNVGRKQLRDDILALHRVPRELVTVSESTFANATEAQRIFQRYTIKPLLLNEQEVLNSQLIPKYYSSNPNKAKDLFFEAPDPVESDEKATAETTSLLFTSGLIKRDEARKANGYPTLNDEYGEEFYRPAPSVLQAPTGPQNETPDGQDTEDAADDSEDSAGKAITGKSSDDDRDALKQFFYEKSLEQEVDYQTTAEQFFSSQRMRVLKGLQAKYTKGGKKSARKVKDFTVDINEEEEILLTIAAFEEVTRRTAIANLQVTNSFLPASRKLTKAALDQLTINLEYFAREITQTTLADLKALLATGIEQNISTADLAGRISDMFRDYTVPRGDKTPRTATIARTEVNSIKGLVQRDVFDNDPTLAGSEWLSAKIPGVTRDDHWNADGQVREVGKPFEVGGEQLRYPGDRVGSAKNTINCLCSLIPVIKSE